MIGLRLGGTELRLYFSFLTFNALLFLSGSRTAMLFYAAAAVHEAAHILAAYFFGQHLRSVEFRGTGIIMEAEKNCGAPFFHGAAVLMAGPAVNLLMWLISSAAGASDKWAEINLGLCLYNLLPYCQLDGGAAISLLICGSPYEREIGDLLLFIKMAVSAALFILTIAVDSSLLIFFAVSVFLLLGDIK